MLFKLQKQLSTLMLLLFAAIATAQLDVEEYKKSYPDKIDPFTGNWTGKWTDDDKDDPEISAQVYALGENKFRINFKHRYDVRCPILHTLEQEANGNTLQFKNDTFFGKFENDTFTGGHTSEGTHFEMKKVIDPSPTLGQKAPRGAIKLFDGKKLDKWRNTKGWDVTEWGTLVVTPGSPDLLTRDRFRDVQVHLEFRLPYLPEGRGQDRGNSGIHMMSAYEIQILDSFGLQGVYNECGALYKIAAPKVNVCRPPLQWQTYDITFIGPRFNKKGKMLSTGRMTVLHNGIPIHHEVDLPWRTGGGLLHNNRHPENHPKHPKSIKLQEHQQYVEFKNIWVVDLEK